MSDAMSDVLGLNAWHKKTGIMFRWSRFLMGKNFGLLFIIAQNISISYILVSNVPYVLTIRHIKRTMGAFDKAEIVRQFGRFFTIWTNYFHNYGCLYNVINDLILGKNRHC
jgi:hypothetical protein